MNLDSLKTLLKWVNPLELLKLLMSILSTSQVLDLAVKAAPLICKSDPKAQLIALAIPIIKDLIRPDADLTKLLPVVEEYTKIKEKEDEEERLRKEQMEKEQKERSEISQNGITNDGGNVKDNSTTTNDSNDSRLLDATWKEQGDPHRICQCYFGNEAPTIIFDKAYALPVDFNAYFSSAGIALSIPKSDPTGTMAGFPGDHMQERRAFVCIFGSDLMLTKCEDFNGTMLDNRWNKVPAKYGFVVHCCNGKAVSRSEVVEL